MALQATEARFRGLPEGVPDPIIISDAEGGIVLMNAEVEKLFGHPRDALVGGPLDVLMPERFRSLHAGRLCSRRAAT